MDPNLVPSDRNLRAFCEAVRYGSFTRAAHHLGLGQPAVSHAVGRLEAELDVRLLDRSRSGVRTTAAGSRLFDAIDPAYRSIDDAVRSMRATGDDAEVSLSVSTSLAHWWLLPRLSDFKRSHPDVALRLVTADSDDRVDMAHLDLWIPLGAVDDTELHRSVLCDEVVIPVASPAVAEAVPPGVEPERLLDAPLLHLDERYRPRFDWNRWFAHFGVTPSSRLPGDRTTDYSLVLQAALDGQGVAIGWGHIVTSLLESGELVALAEPVVTDNPFVILSAADRRLSNGAEALRAWLVRELSEPGVR